MNWFTLIFTITFFLTLRSQGAQPCGADVAVQNFQNSVSSVVRNLPSLEKEIDNCFNLIEYPQYANDARKTLRTLTTEYKAALKTLSQAYDLLKTGRDAEFSRSINALVLRVNSASKPLFEAASYLKRYGFTTSDIQIRGQYKYPRCNSQKNNQPAQKWTRVYNGAVQVQANGKSLLAVANCLSK